MHSTVNVTFGITNEVDRFDDDDKEENSDDDDDGDEKEVSPPRWDDKVLLRGEQALQAAPLYKPSTLQ